MFNSQWLIVNGQWSIVDSQWSIVNGQWSRELLVILPLTPTPVLPASNSPRQR
ncbi:MAG: hypothetical protein KME23_24935 [Goleter apudmare HA4340-LM2]|nr:hypothetical protein [Goleter apudmare HA4340-LM2]